MDKIFIVDLPIKCIVGVYPEEREFEQELIFNITLLLDLSVSCYSDNVKDTIDYEIIENKVIQFVKKSNFELIETLAEKISLKILEFELISSVIIRIDKPNALKNAKSAAIEIIRSKC